MKRKYLRPETVFLDFVVKIAPLAGSGYEGDKEDLSFGGNTGDLGGGEIDADSRRRNSSYSRGGGASYVESRGGWSRGGLW